MSQLSKNDTVAVKGDKKSAFEDFVFVIDKLKLHGIEKISILARTDV